MAYGARALGPRSFQRRPRTGKPSTRAPRQGARSPRRRKPVSHGQDVKGRERRTAATILHMIQDCGKRPLPTG